MISFGRRHQSILTNAQQHEVADIVVAAVSDQDWKMIARCLKELDQGDDKPLRIRWFPLRRDHVYQLLRLATLDSKYDNDITYFLEIAKVLGHPQKGGMQ